MTLPPDPAPAPAPDPGTPTPPAAEPIPLETERVAPATARTPRRLSAVAAAWIVAIVADGIQWLVFPIFVLGAASPIDDVVDVVVAGVLIRLLGWHWAFLPGFLVKLIPTIDLAPTWTAAVFLATRGRGLRGKPPVPGR